MNYDVIIVGAGAMGMAAGSMAAKRGRRTLLIDAFDPPHDRGSHHGDTRIIRYAYAEGVQYVPLALRARTLWEKLQEEAGDPLLIATGHVNVGTQSSKFVKDVIEASERFDLPLDILDHAEAGKRWPGLSLPEDFKACYEPDAGFLKSEACIRAYRSSAERHGAWMLPNTNVIDIRPSAGGVTVATDRGVFHGGALLLSAGARSKDVLEKVGLRLPISPVRKTVGWFRSSDAYRAGRFPTYIVDTGTSAYYGFPDWDGNGVKIGRHDGGQPITTSDYTSAGFGAFPEDENDLRTFLQTYMPGAAGELQSGKTCMYAMTPDEHFIIDRHPEFPHVVVAAGFSGHGFKFASAVGEAASQLLIDGDTEADLSLFALNRFPRKP